MSYEIIWEPRGVIKRFSGLVTDHDMVQSVIDTESDPRFDDLRYVINDFLAISQCAVALADVDDVVAMDKGASLSNPRIRIAVVAICPDIIALATHYANSPLNAYTTRIFADMEQARAWLEIPPGF